MQFRRRTAQGIVDGYTYRLALGHCQIEPCLRVERVRVDLRQDEGRGERQFHLYHVAVLAGAVEFDLLEAAAMDGVRKA